MPPRRAGLLAADEPFEALPAYRDFRAPPAPFTRRGAMEHFDMTAAPPRGR